LERELAPFVERARAKAKAQDRELDLSNLSNLQSSDFESLKGTDAVGVETSRQDSRVGDKEVEVKALASPALQLRPKRARQVLARYRG
jgi:hypothetical protein